MEWKGINGESPMKPKDDGMGLMGLGVNTHGIGFGKQLSDEGLKTINEFCKIHRPHYMDKDTAKKIEYIPNDLNTICIFLYFLFT